MRLQAVFLLLGFLSGGMLPPSFAFAQESAASAGVDLRHGMGPLGRYSEEQGQVVALGAVEGTVLSSRVMHRRDNRYYYKYKIATEGGSVFEVMVDAQDGKLEEIRVENWVRSEPLPFSLMNEALAKASALSYVNENGKGLRDPKLVSFALTIHDRRPVYSMLIKRAVRSYRLLMDAQDGSVLSMEEAR